MKTLITALFIMACLAVVTFAQVESERKAYVFAEFDTTSASNLAFIWKPYTSVLENEDAEGYIINYGSKTAVRGRRNLFLMAIGRARRGHNDPPRITFIDGPYEKTTRSVMWIVPQGAERPTP